MQSKHIVAVIVAGLLTTPVVEAQESPWEGSWLNTASSLESNVYEMLTISAVDDSGFTYSFECRDIPYGPNAVWSAEARATFRGPSGAEDPVSGQTFSLTVDLDDRHSRVITTSLERAYACTASGEGSSDEFVLQRSVYRAGFDCDQATTSIENAICWDELIAFGDRSMTMAYRELMGAFSDEDRQLLRVSQRTWLRERNRSCALGDAVDNLCLARLYADRLATLRKLQDPGLGGEPRFDASYALGLLARGADLRQDAAFRLALYPLEMDNSGATKWQADATGLLFEQTYTDTHIVGPSDVDFRYTDMLFVGSEGTVWTAGHTEPLLPLEYLEEHNPHQVWIAAGRDPFVIRSEHGFQSADAPTAVDDVPDLVRAWLHQHPITEAMRFSP